MLLDGRDPASGDPLAGTARRAGGNVAFDLTFAAPKSVSVLAAVGDELRSERRCSMRTRAGVRAGLDYLEREACFVRRGRNGADGAPGRRIRRSGLRPRDGPLGRSPPARAPGDRQPGEGAGRTLERPRHAPGLRPRQDRRHDRRRGDARRAVAQSSASSGARSPTASPSWSPCPPRCASTSRPATPRSWRRRPLAGSPRAQVSPPSSARRATESASSREARRSPAGAPAPPSTASARHELRRALGRARGITPSDYTERLRAQATHMLGPGGLTRQSSTFTRREVIQQLAEVHPEGAPRRTPRAPGRRLPRAHLRRPDARGRRHERRPPRDALHHPRHAARRGAPARRGHRPRSTRARSSPTPEPSTR